MIFLSPLIFENKIIFLNFYCARNLRARARGNSDNLSAAFEME
jgi:hypothetical protein